MRYGFKPNTVQPLSSRTNAVEPVSSIEAEEDLPGFQGKANARGIVGSHVEGGRIGGDNLATFMHGQGGIENTDEMLAQITRHMDLDAQLGEGFDDDPTGIGGGGLANAPLEAGDFDEDDDDFLGIDNRDSVVAFAGPSDHDLALQKKLAMALQQIKTAHVKMTDIKRKYKRSRQEAKLLEESLDEERNTLSEERLAWATEKAQLKQKSNFAGPVADSNTKGAIAERERQRKTRGTSWHPPQDISSSDHIIL
jgi:hypothetical protein